MYCERTHGMMSLRCMTSPLRTVSFFCYYRYPGKLIRRYSIQNKKALYLLQYMILVEGQYGGFLPENAEVLMAFPDFAPKKQLWC